MYDLSSQTLLEAFEELRPFPKMIAMDPDGKRLAFVGIGQGKNNVMILNRQDGALQTLEGHTVTVHSIALSPTKPIAASGDDNLIILWDLISGKPIRRITIGTDWVNTLAFSPDGQLLASGDDSSQILIHDLATQDVRIALESPVCCTMMLLFHPSGQSIVAIGADDVVRVWDIETGNLMHEMKEHTFIVPSIAVSPDGNILASASHDQTIRLWNLSDGKNLRTLTLPDASEVPLSVAFSSDGRFLLVGTHRATVHFFGLPDEQPLFGAD